MKRYYLLVVLGCLFTINAVAQSDANNKKSYTAHKINISEAPTIDGALNDGIWEAVDWAGDFIENEPDENTAPSEQTQFKIMYDDKFLYVGIRAFDSSPEKIIKRLSRRDGFVGDRVNLVLDTYLDRRTAFVFTTTAAGVKGDEIVTDNGNNIDDSWNPIWYTNAKIDDLGWTAEMKIPFSQLRFGESQEQVWGMSIARTIFRHNEMSVWDRIPAGSPGFVSEIGTLYGLKGLTPQNQLEIQPFVATQYDSYPKESGNPFRDGSDFKLNGGLDAKIGITNDLTLDLTVNPDFGQVDADPGAITLDGFEIFFNERRPFFVENKNIFDYQFGGNQDNVFFSRRIGRSPQSFPSIGDYVDQPVNTTILGAAKFSGKTKNGWSIGVLESVTANEYAEIDTNGNRTEELVEPLTNYFVGRLQKDFNNRNSYIGGIFTATNRNLEDHLEFLRKEAYTGGVDFMHQWKNREFFFRGFFVGSHVKGSKESIALTQTSITHLFQREDAGHVDVDPNRTSLSGTGGRLEFGKAGGGNWTYDASVIWRSPELELNDVGFLRQADEIRQHFNVGWRTLKPTGTFRQISANFRQHTTYDFDGNMNRVQYALSGNFILNNNYSLNITGVHKPRIYINTFLRGGPRWRFSQENHISAFVGTDHRKKLRSNFGLAYSWAKQKNFHILFLFGDVTYEPTNFLRVSLEPNFNRTPSKTQYVTQLDHNGVRRYILGTIDNKTLSTALRVNYTVNPNLSIQFYGEPFISRANYKNFKYVTNATAENLYDRFHQYGSNEIDFSNGLYNVDENTDGSADYSFRNPDFSFVQFRSNLVLRWEYIPGSELFLVWSKGITGLVNPMDSLLDGLDTGILDQKGENIFLLKATYRFVL